MAEKNSHHEKNVIPAKVQQCSVGSQTFSRARSRTQRTSVSRHTYLNSIYFNIFIYYINKTI